MVPTPTPPQLVDALAALKLARFHREGRLWPEALDHYNRAVSIWPDNAAIHAEIGDMAEESRNWQLAEQASRRQLALRSDRQAAWRLAVAVFMQGRIDEAYPLFAECARTNPGYLVEYNLGVCCNQLRHFEEAAQHFRRALRHEENHPQTHCVLAVALALAQDYEAVEQVIERALQLFPDNADVGYVAADHYLRAGKFGRGFDLYHHRWKAREVGLVPRQLPWPAWRGESFDGLLVVWAEQGLGDELLFASLFPEVMARHPEVVFECDARLHPLLARSFPGMRLLDRKRDDILGLQVAGDVRQCAAGDLGGMLRRAPEDFPAHDGWLKADPVRTEALRRDYRERFPGELLVGISWTSKRNGLGDTKSIPPDMLAPILQVPGVRFISVQYGDVKDDIARARAASGVDIVVDERIDNWNDIDGFCAQLAALDLVISVSNTTVHLAGALGVPCWTLLNRHVGLIWYWGYAAGTSRWYPSMRPLYNTQRGDWAPLVAQVVDELRAAARRAR